MQTTTQSLFAHAVRSMISRGLWLPVYSLSFVQMISGEFCNNKMARDQNFVALKALIAIRKYELTYLNRKIKTYENSDGIIHFFFIHHLWLWMFLLLLIALAIINRPFHAYACIDVAIVCTVSIEKSFHSWTSIDSTTGRQTRPTCNE